MDIHEQYGSYNGIKTFIGTLYSCVITIGPLQSMCERPIIKSDRVSLASICDRRL